MSEVVAPKPPAPSGAVAPRVISPGPDITETRINASPAIYYLPRGQAVTTWADHFIRAAALGFNAVLLESPFAARQDASAPHSEHLVYDFGCLDEASGGDAAAPALQAAGAAARTAGLDLLIDIALDRMALEAPMLVEHADWFVHSPIGARFRYLGAADATVDWWDARIAAWQAMGITGFRCLNAAQVPHFVWSRLIGAAQARNAGTACLAWTIGAAPEAVAALVGAGFSQIFSSSCWWDFKAGWLNEEAGRLAGLAPAIAIAAPPGAEGWPAAQRTRALRLAATYAAGWMMEADFCTGADFDLAPEVKRLNALRAQNQVLRGADTALLASSPSAEIAVLARGAREKFVIALNPSLTAPAAMQAAAIMPALRLSTLQPLRGFAEISPSSMLTLEAAGARMFTASASPENILPKAAPLNPQNARIAIETIAPQVDAGQFPVRRIVGELVTVRADLIADGHDKLAGEILFRAADETKFRAAPLNLISNDRWEGQFPLHRVGRHIFAVTAWKDVYATFVDEVTKKHAAGVPVALELREGLGLIEATSLAAPKGLQTKLQALLNGLKDADEAQIRETLRATETIALMRKADLRKFATTSHHIMLDAERLGAGFASWYEIFPRSQAGDGVTHGTFIDVIGQLPRIAEMGFDVLYFPPIHPIGRTNRKGRNNTLTPATDDPGSPYAIGSAEGGHDALHPQLGSLADFHRMRDAAAALGIELALDFAIQCAPDHPWLKAHPEWFDWRPDGSLRYAENPPKKYEDIVNVDFYAPGAQPALWIALRDVVQFWVDQGVKLFRVDNPHTKPLPFWEWLIADIRARHPDVVFLAEAFTRPKVMYRLAKIGFSQSYTYFTWRNTKVELEEYLTELTTTAPVDFFRPHFFVNTPDINPVFLQTAGRGGFLIRAALAATLSGLWGVYNGFELCEATPVPGKEDYLNSEKYQLKAWDYDRPGNIVAEISRLNRIRKTNAALHSHRNVEFLPADNDQVIYFRKFAPDGNVLLVAISLDPFNMQDATIELPLWRFGLADDGALEAEDLMRDFKFTWHGKYQTVQLNPYEQPFCIWRVAPAAG